MIVKKQSRSSDHLIYSNDDGDELIIFISHTLLLYAMAKIIQFKVLRVVRGAHPQRN